MEEELKLLKNFETPDKVFYSTIYFLSEWKCEENVHSLDSEEPASGLNNCHIVTVEEVGNNEEGSVIGSAVLGFLKEGEPADKAVKLDNLAIPEYLWDKRIMNKLTEYWKSDKFNGEGVDFQNPTIRCKVKKGLQGLQQATLGYWKQKVWR